MFVLSIILFFSFLSIFFPFIFHCLVCC
jgi:hypothetical protein